MTAKIMEQLQGRELIVRWVYWKVQELVGGEVRNEGVTGNRTNGVAAGQRIISGLLGGSSRYDGELSEREMVN